MAKIARIYAREVLDSRGHPTVEVEVHCDDGAVGRAIVPSGASTGGHEARELRDGEPHRYGGRGVRMAVENVRTVLAPALVGEEANIFDVDKLLRHLDGTPDKSRLGANAILGTSLAVAHALANSAGLPLYRFLDFGERCRLPMPMVNMISGGLHAGSNMEFQDFLFLPIGAKSYAEALEMSVRVYRELGRVLSERGYEAALVGDEGGYGPKLRSNEEAVQLLLEAFNRAGYEPGRQAAIAIDVASTHFYRDGHYHLEGQALSAEQMIDRLVGLIERYPILSIEDGLAEDDWPGWKKLTAALGKRIQLIGDDLFATNTDRVSRGITEGVANSVLVKPNQIGTLTETLGVLERARQARYAAIVSARSGETEDTTIADLAVATGAGQIKIGSVTRSERLAKYNQLLRIEEALRPDARFAGRAALAPL